MRQEIIDYIKGLKLKNYKASDELPFSNSGTALYIKNPKVFYVDDDQTNVEPLISLMNGVDVLSTIHSVRVFVTSDAKSKPQDYDAVMSSIQAATYIAPPEYFRKEVDVNTSYENDLTVTAFEFRFTKLS